MEIRTKRWTRSPRGCVLGVVTGLAEWRGFPVDTTRLIVVLIFLFTAIFPCALIYLVLAIVLPEQTRDDIVSRENWREQYNDFSDSPRRRKERRNYHFSKEAENASFREKTNDDLEREYEELKKKVETMENDVFNKEKDWDNRFKND